MKTGRDAGKKRSGASAGSKKGARPSSSRAPAASKTKPVASKSKAVASKPKAAPPKPAAKAKPASPPAKGRAAPKASPAARAVARPVAPLPVARALPKVEAPPKFRREYRKWLERLIALRHRLRDEGNRLEEEGLKALEQEVSVDHMADYGSDSYEQDTTLALIENKTEALRDVDDAIKRIELKTYGLCEECEQLIPSGRLEVLPHARYCVKCQAQREGPGA